MKTNPRKIKDIDRVQAAIRSIYEIWVYDTKIAQATGNSWYKVEYRQALRDCLESFRRQGLIEDFADLNLTFPTDNRPHCNH